VIRIPGQKVTLRPLRRDEVDRVVSSYRRTAPALGLKSPSREAIHRRVERSGRLVRGQLDLAIEAEGRLVGDVEARAPAHAFPPGVYEIGVTVFDDGDRGHGYGLEATRLLVDHLFDAEEAARVQASTAEWNGPMRAILARLGFHEEGVLRAYFPAGDSREDYVMYAITRADWLAGDADPDELDRP
jgi:RimJ/RimL family protein N-acetyltransferase